MKNKKNILSVFIICAIIAVGFIVVENTYVKHRVMNADRYILAHSFNDLEKVSDLIIRATVLSDKENIVIKDNDGDMAFGYTITNLKINDVFKGDILKEDIVKITEECWIYDNGVGTEHWTQGNYKPAKGNSEYIFFLKKYDDKDPDYSGMYFPVDLEMGKYAVSKPTINKKNVEVHSLAEIESSINNMGIDELEIFNNESQNVEVYRRYYKDVIDKYVINKKSFN